MGNNTLLAGTALMLLLLVPVWLSPQESLHPSRRTLILLGVAGGLVSIAAFEALRWNAPELHIVAYPTATAFVALFFGVPAAAITALLALQAALWTDTSAVWPATTVLGGALATGWAWRSLGQRWAWPDWAPLAGLTLTLPLVVSLVTTATSTAPEGASNMHWHHGAGVLMLGIGWLVIASRARAELARNGNGMWSNAGFSVMAGFTRPTALPVPTCSRPTSGSAGTHGATRWTLNAMPPSWPVPWTGWRKATRPSSA